MAESDSIPPVSDGDVLAGKYRVERVLGAGGMGVVVVAMHLELEQRVAVKFLLPNALENPEATARFMREARAAARIKSEHVARVIDVGRLESGAPYIVMEFLRGSDLGAVLQHGALQMEEAVDYVLQACEAMAEAHAAGIVHRDLKPANLFLTQRADGSPIVKVLDFGISKVRSPDVIDASLTKTSTLMGSPLYMSPEQLRSARNVDHRADIWSLGIILFELLTCRLPFAGETLPQLIASILSDPPEPLRARHPEFSPELENVLAKALEKDLDRRYRSIGEFALALAPLAPRRSRDTAERIFRLSGMDEPPSTEPAPPGVLAASVPAPATRTHGGWAGTQNRGKRRSTVAVTLGLAAGAGALLAGILFVHGRTTRRPSPAPVRTEPAAFVASPPRAPDPVVVEPAPVAALPAAQSASAVQSARPAKATLRAGSPPKASAAALNAGAPISAEAARPKNPLSIDLK
jgi:eukaryotic-like serine/threonine-protein kinase